MSKKDRVTSYAEMQFMRGRKLFRSGDPAPAKPCDYDASPQACVWYGWMLERACQWIQRRRVMKSLGVRD